ncbi:hypothetical protein BJ165DRAFT_755295 [Panaeolus papilionaceus]|nr:hypothetical protein BJ165DRAFT_755295 [Panaeolus papilionaceus]
MAAESSSSHPLKRKRTSLSQPQPAAPASLSMSSRKRKRISRADLTPSPISPPSLPVSISRRALSQSIGVPQRIPRWHSADHSHRFLFPTSKYQPHAPSTPGTAGRILDLSMDGYRGGPWSVFYQLGDERAKQTMMWGYAGEYLASDGGEADERDWAFLADGTKKTYTERVVKSRTLGPTLDIRSRISFRKANCQRTPSTKQLQRHTAALIENGFNDELVAEEVDLAFDVGYEVR